MSKKKIARKNHAKKPRGYRGPGMTRPNSPREERAKQRRADKQLEFNAHLQKAQEALLEQQEGEQGYRFGGLQLVDKSEQSQQAFRNRMVQAISDAIREALEGFEDKESPEAKAAMAQAEGAAVHPFYEDELHAARVCPRQLRTLEVPRTRIYKDGKVTICAPQEPDVVAFMGAMREAARAFKMPRLRDDASAGE